MSKKGTLSGLCKSKEIMECAFGMLKCKKAADFSAAFLNVVEG